jgi:hypothetical protein
MAHQATVQKIHGTSTRRKSQAARFLARSAREVNDASHAPLASACPGHRAAYEHNPSG